MVAFVYMLAALSACVFVSTVLVQHVHFNRSYAFYRMNERLLWWSLSVGVGLFALGTGLEGPIFRLIL